MIVWKKRGNFPSRPMIFRKFHAAGNFEKSFLEWEKMASGKTLRHFLHASFFMFILWVSNHAVFLVQLDINFLIKLKFENSLMQINSKLNLKLYDYLY